MFAKFGLFEQNLNKHVIQKYAEAVFTPLKCNIPSLNELKPYFENNRVLNKKKIVIHPYASKFTKTWENPEKLIHLLNDRGYETYIIGKGRKIDGAQHIDTPNLGDLIAFLSDAALLISTDSGPMHIATALNIKVIALFGSTVKEFGFYPEFHNCMVLEKEVPCRPCDIHGLDKCPIGTHLCMDFSPEFILENVCKMIEK